MIEPQRSRRGGRNRGRGRSGQPKPQSLWRPVPAPDPVTAITPAADPAALIRSIESPPLRGGQMAEHYMAAVVERAAAYATALAASVDLLAEPRD